MIILIIEFCTLKKKKEWLSVTMTVQINLQLLEDVTNAVFNTGA